MNLDINREKSVMKNDIFCLTETHVFEENDVFHTLETPASFEVQNIVFCLDKPIKVIQHQRSLKHPF